jgi:hypothetical protein
MTNAKVNGPLRFSPQMKVINAQMLAEMVGMKIKYVRKGTDSRKAVVCPIR